MIVVSGRSRRVGLLFLAMGASMISLVAALVITSSLRTRPPPPTPITAKLTPQQRFIARIVAVGITLVVAAPFLYVGTRFYRGGVNLRLTRHGLEFPMLPGIKLGCTISWADTVGVRELNSELLIPAGYLYMRMNRVIAGANLMMLIDVARPAGTLTFGGWFVNGCYRLFERMHRDLLIPSLQGRALIEMVFTNSLPDAPLIKAINTLTTDPEMRSRYADSEIEYTIAVGQDGSPVFVEAHSTRLNW